MRRVMSSGASASRLSFISVFLVATLVVASLPASAIGRGEGDFWAYTLEVGIPGVGMSATGSMKYEFVSKDALTVDGAKVTVNALRVTGSAVSSVPLIDLTALLVTEGYIYEEAGGVGMVGSDLTYWANVSWGSGDYSWPVNSAGRTVLTYSPALLSGFEPGATALGSTWTETTEVKTATYSMVTGMVNGSETDHVSVSCSVHDEMVQVPTGVGKFDTYMVTANMSDGGKVVYWWSEEVRMFARQETYVEGISEPVQTLVLREYSGGSGGSPALLFIVVGAVALAVALVALAVVLIRRRPPKPSGPPQDLPPLEVPPPP